MKRLHPETQTETKTQQEGGGGGRIFQPVRAPKNRQNRNHSLTVFLRSIQQPDDVTVTRFRREISLSCNIDVSRTKTFHRSGEFFCEKRTVLFFWVKFRNARFVLSLISACPPLPPSLSIHSPAEVEVLFVISLLVLLTSK